MLVKYVRDIVGNPVACVVATAKGRIGWSVKHENDCFDKETAKKIAVGRANCNRVSNRPFPNRKMWDNQMEVVNLADVLHDEIANMNERSVKYFK